MDFFVKDNELKSITIDDISYNISIITNRFYQHLSSVIIGKITVGEPLYIKSFLLNDNTILDVFQEKKYNIIDATQKFLICKRNYQFEDPKFDLSLIIENEQETYLNPKNLTETDKDLSSFVLNRNHILNAFRSTTKWPLYNLYVKYIKYLNGENNSFDNMTNQELKNLFKSKNTIVFRNNITRKRRNFLKGKANIFIIMLSVMTLYLILPHYRYLQKIQNILTFPNIL